MLTYLYYYRHDREVVGGRDIAERQERGSKAYTLHCLAMSLPCSMQRIEYIHSSIILIRPISQECTDSTDRQYRQKKALLSRAKVFTFIS